MSITKVGKILFLETSLIAGELICNYLRDRGYEIIKATTAKEALEITLEVKPNAIITDVIMPGMSGFELCRLLKSHPTHQKVPIVICSDKNQEIHRLWARKQGADAYVTKPYTGEELLNVIQSVAA